MVHIPAPSLVMQVSIAVRWINGTACFVRSGCTADTLELGMVHVLAPSLVMQVSVAVTCVHGTMILLKSQCTEVSLKFAWAHYSISHIWHADFGAHRHGGPLDCRPFGDPCWGSPVEGHHSEPVQPSQTLNAESEESVWCK